MTIVETIQYQRTKKKVLKKYILTKEEIDTTLILFKEDKESPKLQYKKMICKKDKNRYSIRILNTQYRILMSVINQEFFLVCVCDHDEYDMRNKGC